MSDRRKFDLGIQTMSARITGLRHARNIWLQGLLLAGLRRLFGALPAEDDTAFPVRRRDESKT